MGPPWALWLALTPLIWLPDQASAGLPRLWWLLAWGPLWLGPTLWRPLSSPTLRWPLASWLAWAGLALLSALWTPHPGAAIEGALLRLSWAVGLAAGLSVVSREAAPRIAALAGALAALEALWQPGGTFGNPAFLGGWLALCLVWSLVGLRRAPWTVRAAHALAAALMLVGLWRSESLGAWAAVALGAPMALTRARRWLILGLAGGALGALALWASSAPSSGLAHDLHAHLVGRWRLFQVALRVDGGLLGVGAGGFHRHFLEAQAGQGGLLWTNAYHAHNGLLHTWVEQGILGLLALALPVLAGLRRAASRPEAAVLWAAAALSMVQPLLPGPGLGWLVGLALGVTLAPTTEAAPPVEVEGRGPRRLWASPLATGLLWLPIFVVCSGHLVADRWLAAGSGPEIADALSLRPERLWRRRAAALLTLDPDRAFALAARASMMEPSVPGWALVGEAAAHAGRPEAAIAAYQEATRLHPGLFAGHYNLARLYELRGERAAARRHADVARALRPTDPRLRDLVR